MRVHEPKPTLSLLIVLGLISWLLYAAFAWCCQWFGPNIPGTDRPIIAGWSLLVVLFLAHLVALRVAIRTEGHRDLLATILIFAAAFRALLLFTEPFQEVDLYRYIWDGHSTIAGVSPFRYAPQQVRTARIHESNSDDLNRLVRLRDESPAVRQILMRVHFGELPTVYPPTSQAVFAVAAMTTPADAEVATHLTIMKAWILLFDFGAMCGLIVILRFVKMPIGWSVAYGWCPLVIKEFANSGHLDSIAVCLTTWAVVLFLRALFADRPASPRGRICLLASAVTLALAVGAKLYPVVLVPLFACSAWRMLGWKPVAASAVVFTTIVLLLASPFLRDAKRPAEDTVAPPTTRAIQSAPSPSLAPRTATTCSQFSARLGRGVRTRFRTASCDSKSRAAASLVEFTKSTPAGRLPKSRSAFVAARSAIGAECISDALEDERLSVPHRCRESDAPRWSSCRSTALVCDRSRSILVRDDQSHSLQNRD